MQIHNAFILLVSLTACAVEAEPEPASTSAPQASVDRDVLASASFGALMDGAYAQLSGDQSLVSLKQLATAAPGHLLELRDEVPAFGALSLAQQRELIASCASAYKPAVLTQEFYATTCQDGCTADYVIGWSTCTFLAIVDPPSVMVCFPSVTKEMSSCMAGCNGGA